ncbi:unnamed protein product [Hymenolepis diminuta]|uniref:HOOK_N domain-containing protein n=1 Tax=Hymenolepis diminuta TaxID=6216 RepID=A0A0R3SBG9_HYMDI|nr:unnamed protein product [Hymenolepis diminuta]
MCLSKLCYENSGRCLRLGAEGTRIIFIFLMRFQTQLCDQEHLLKYDWTNSEQIFVNWHPFHGLVACAIESVFSCIANCSENRALFVQHGGFTILLNLLEEAETVTQIRMELKEMMIIPVMEDIQELDQSENMSRERYENILKRKLDIIKAAIDRDSCLEEESYVLPREIIKQREIALERELDAKLRTTDYAYLCASRALKQRALEVSRSNFDKTTENSANQS